MNVIVYALTAYVATAVISLAVVAIIVVVNKLCSGGDNSEEDAS